MLTCRNRADVPGGPGRCCTGRTVFSEGSCCGSRPSCGTSLRGTVGPSSDPCSDAGRRGDAGLPATTGCCFLGTCTFCPSASLLCLEHRIFFLSLQMNALPGFSQRLKVPRSELKRRAVFTFCFALLLKKCALKL